MKKNKKTVLEQVKGHTKIIAGLVTGYGVGQIMGAVMKDYKPDATGIRKMVIKLGAAALTGMVIKRVSDYVGGQVDEVFDFAEDVFEKAQKKGDASAVGSAS